MSEPISARDRLHIKRCQGKCVLESDQPDTDCLDLTWYLDRTEEEALYRAASRLLDLPRDMALQSGSEVTQGVLIASQVVNPYTRKTSGHLVRKDDGTPVRRFPGDGLD